jgi:prefoldin subunit 5
MTKFNMKVQPLSENDKINFGLATIDAKVTAIESRLTALEKTLNDLRQVTGLLAELKRRAEREEGVK